MKWEKIMTFAEKLKYVRKANHLTQTELAEALGISRSNLANIELGNVTPTALFINCLSLTLNVDKEYLMNEDIESIEIPVSRITVSKVLEQYELLTPEYQQVVDVLVQQLIKLQK